jgi:hypothetical protein
MTQTIGPSEVGTEEWMNETGGKLTFRQAIFLATQGSAQVLFDRTNLNRITPRDEQGQAKRVESANRKLSSVLAIYKDRVLERQGEALLHHACRTFLLGSALVSDDVFREINFEAAAIAALAHDDGMVHPSTPGNCFTADSAKEVEEMLSKEDSSMRLVQEARAAVISHFQPILPSNASATAKMIAVGASADVMGVGLRNLSTSLHADLWQEWPDLGFIPEVKGLLKGERARAPFTRPGVLAISGMPYLLRSSK